MSGFKWLYEPDRCDGNYCVGDCDECSIPDLDDEDLLDEETEKEIEREILAARKGEE